MTMECIVISEQEYLQHQSDYDGCCLSCGEWTCGGVEPDAEHYKCAACDALEVFGAEHLLIMGVVEFS
jgi:hypothetical protein